MTEKEILLWYGLQRWLFYLLLFLLLFLPRRFDHKRLSYVEIKDKKQNRLYDLNVCKQVDPLTNAWLLI